MSIDLSTFDRVVVDDVGSLLFGELIGSGMNRNTYVCAWDRMYVIKIENSFGRFQNVLEWDMWEWLKDSKWAKWLAPCRAISTNGRVLVQHYAADINPLQMPKKIPSFLSDSQVKNWGMIEGKPVCRDYGVNLSVETITRNAKMIEPMWSDLTEGGFNVQR